MPNQRKERPVDDIFGMVPWDDAPVAISAMNPGSAAVP
jgi:hypothetical protein